MCNKILKRLIYIWKKGEHIFLRVKKCSVDYKVKFIDLIDNIFRQAE